MTTRAIDEHDADPATGAVRIGAAAAALGVSIDTLRRWERTGRAAFERRGGDRWMAEPELSRLLRARVSTNGASAPNRLAGVVIAVKRDGVMAQVELACGPYRIVSVIPLATAEELRLRPGAPATAVVNATSIAIDA